MKNGEYAVEEKKVATDREYTVWEILQGNLKVWWLMLFGALAGALLLGATNITRNRSFVSEKNYEDDYRVMASLMVEEYSGESAAERVGTVITVAESRSTYEKMKQLSGYDMEYLAYQDMFDLEQNTSSDVMTVHVKYPRTYGTFSLENEEDALEFAGYLLEAVKDTVRESIGKNGVHVLDEPYVADAQKGISPMPRRYRSLSGRLPSSCGGSIFWCYCRSGGLRRRTGVRQKRTEFEG